MIIEKNKNINQHYLCIEFITSPQSYFQNIQINSKLLQVIIPLRGLKHNYKITPKLFQKVNNSQYHKYEQIQPLKLIFDFSSFELKTTPISLQSVIELEPKVHQKTIISFIDSILFCHPQTYVKLLQELQVENELILDSSLLMRVETILSYLNVLK
ncbi:MAG: hypothetical protein ACLFPL_02285 [Candidatus Nanoarchaeia archaeon]